MKYHAAQFLLQLIQPVTTERGHSLICIPDRMSAECELTKLKAEYGPRLIKAVIRKDKPGRDNTYTLRYFTRDTDQVRLF
jgi:hypothetical protein